MAKGEKHLAGVKGKDGNLTAVSWEDALVTVAKMLDSTPSDQIAAVAGGLVDAEVTSVFFMNQLEHQVHFSLCWP